MMHIPQIGDSLPEYFMEVTQESVYRYAEASGDYNPLHINEEFAARNKGFSENEHFWEPEIKVFPQNEPFLERNKGFSSE